MAEGYSWASGRRLVLLSEVFALLAERQDEREIRTLVGEKLLQLLEADHYASYLWSDSASSFDHRIALHMSDANLSRYEAFYQYNDPITHRLRQRSEPTLVTEILPQRELIRTEFFNDFLRHDGLYWGVNLHVRIGAEGTGDLRIWRDQRRGNFDAQDVAILRLVAPAFRAALGRCLAASNAGTQAKPTALGETLTDRELQVAHLVARGLSDKEVAEHLHISFTTVRSHLKSVFGKLGVDSRVKLATRLR